METSTTIPIGRRIKSTPNLVKETYPALGIALLDLCVQLVLIRVIARVVLLVNIYIFTDHGNLLTMFDVLVVYWGRDNNNNQTSRRHPQFNGTLLLFYANIMQAGSSTQILQSKKSQRLPHAKTLFMQACPTLIPDTPHLLK